MAAAFAALASLQNDLYLIQNQPRHCFSFEEVQIQRLGKSAAYLIKFMKSYDNSHGARKEASELLEMRIARAAQAALNVIESHIEDWIRCGRTRTSPKSPRFLLDLQKVIDGMDFMRRKAIKVKSQSGMEAAEQPAANSAASTSSAPLTSTETAMVGFEDDLLRLLELLAGTPSARQVIPIVGMGGIGKTTLAKNAFKHPYIEQHFDVRLWATISQRYRAREILKQLVSVLRKFTSKTNGESSTSYGTLHEMGEELHKGLYGRRYLIVLDDMWSVEAWDDVKLFFPDTVNGSRIVVTTRHSYVANHLGFSSLALSFLDEDCSWDLFCQSAFTDEGCPRELEAIGKRIVDKCRGLPLAIAVLGGHLRKSSMAPEYWENVANDMNSALNSTEIEEQCLNVLSMSYTYLPCHLKPCFLLLGAFPEDQEIYASEVVNRWIAEGVIEPFEDTSLEVVAEYYLYELSERNLIIVESLGYREEIYTFKVHDLLRELCLQIARKDELVCTYDTSRVRRLDDVAVSASESIFQQVNLRCIEVYYNAGPNPYLLPSSMSLLWNLQRLRITSPHKSTVIAPYEIWEMLQLRHLEVDPVCLPDPLPVERLDDEADDSVLRNLRTLSNAENFTLSEEVCKRIPNIRELHLLYSNEASSYYSLHNLSNFHELECLACEFHGDSKWRDFALSLTFPNSLRRLCLSGCRLDWEELTAIVGSLPLLAVLQLHPMSVTGSVWTPLEGNFLRLTILEISGCDDIVCWNAYSSHFPVLKHLFLRKLAKLDEFPSDIAEIPTLRWIIMEFCSLSSTVSAMAALLEQQGQGNEDLQLHVTFRGDEETLECFNNIVLEEHLSSNNIILHIER